MINFFRKKRKKLADDNKALKYARYAFGEIALVVIGILIALSINNWNETQKEKKKLYATYTIVSKDLQNDINDIDAILNHYESIKPCYEKVLDGSMTKKYFYENVNCSRILMGFPDFSMDLRGYQLLNNFDNKSSEISLTLEIVQFYTKNIFEIKGNEELKAEHFNDNYKHWKDHSTWLSDFVTNRHNDTIPQNFIDYAINSQDYKNRTALFYLLNYEVLNPQYVDFRENAKALVNRIEEFNSQQ